MSDSDGIIPSQETSTLINQARSLINVEFRTLKNVTNQERYRTPKNTKLPSSPSSKNSGVPSVSESVKDARKRLRKEWESLKNSSELEDDSIEEKIKEIRRREAAKQILAGVVAYIEVPNKKKIERIKYLLTSMGATVYDSFSKEVTHIVFKNGSIETYKRAKLLNVYLVSVLWVEACKNSKSKVLEKLFPVYDRNDYSNSPRVFRKFMEYQSKHFEYDENAGTIVRKTQQKPSIVLKMHTLNIGSPDKHISKVVSGESPNKKSKIIESPSNELNSSSSALSLHLSLESSSNEENVPQKIAPNEIDFAQNVISPDIGVTVDQFNEKYPDKGITGSPVKRRLFKKHPLHHSFVKFSQDSSQNSSQPRLEKTIVVNPYEPNVKNKQPNKNDKSKMKNKEKPDITTKCGLIRPAAFEYDMRLPPKNFGKHNKPSLVTTLLHTDENIYVKNIISVLGTFHFKTTVDETTTHIVAGGPNRTINILKGIARGCWIVTKDWVEHSASAGHWIAEPRFELVDFSLVVRRSRFERQAFGKYFGMDIFDDCGPIYISKSSEPSYKDLCELVKLCGGELCTDFEEANIVVGDDFDGKMCVSELWILDSITYGRYKSVAKYVI